MTTCLAHHYTVVVVAHSLRVTMQAITLIICLTLPRVIPDLTLHKCCQRGELLSLHTKECRPDRKKREENISLPVLDPTKESHQDHLVTFDFVALEECQTKQKVNLYFDVYGVDGKFMFFDKHAVELIDQATVCFDRALDSKTNSETFVAQKCLDCEGSTCLNFCCPEGFTKLNKTCIKEEEEETTESGAGYQLHTNFTYVSAQLHCQDIWKFDSKELKIKEANLVEIEGGLYETSEYCLNQLDDHWAVLLCQKDDSQDGSRSKVTKLAVMSVSIVALLVVILLHLVIEELRGNHITKLKIPLYLSILLSFLVVVVSSGVDFLGTRTCVFIGFLLQFSALSVFFWLTAISVDVWLTFKSFRNPANQASRIKECYLFSILSPLGVTLTTIFLQFYQSEDTSSYVHPR